MSTAALTHIAPIKGVPDGKDSPDPAVRQAWLDQRAGGITATEIRDWGNGAKRREIITNKVTMVTEDLSHIPAIRHGNLREPMIAEWIERKFGITPCDNVYSHGENPRHLASPDGISLDPFSKELIVGTEDAVLAEIKTSKHNLHPGRLDAAHVLVEIDPASHFSRSNYYMQMQWQMYVMNATRTLFAWEQHNGIIDPETGTFTPIGVPEYAWIPRDQKLIDVLVGQVAPRALEEIDAARLSNSAEGLPPASNLPTEHAILVADLLAARAAEATAKAKKDQAWEKLQEFYLAEGVKDQSIDAGFAKVTVSTSTQQKKVVDMDAARRRAPQIVAKYEALVERYTKVKPVTSRRLTITEPRKPKAGE